LAGLETPLEPHRCARPRPFRVPVPVLRPAPRARQAPRRCAVLRRAVGEARGAVRAARDHQPRGYADSHHRKETVRRRRGPGGPACGLGVGALGRAEIGGTSRSGYGPGTPVAQTVFATWSQDAFWLRNVEQWGAENVHYTLRGSYGYCNARAVHRNARPGEGEPVRLPRYQRHLIPNPQRRAPGFRGSGV